MRDVSFNQSYRWYAVYVRAKWEKKVYAELVQKRIEAYLPLKKERRQWSDRVKIIEEPLLRGYLFVKVSNKEFYDVLIVSGVLHYVCFGGKAATIPECQIEDLKLFLEVANESVTITSESVSRGDHIRVVSGPFKSVCGEVVEIRGKSRLLLRFGSLGYCVFVELGASEVEALHGIRV